MEDRGKRIFSNKTIHFDTKKYKKGLPFSEEALEFSGKNLLYVESIDLCSPSPVRSHILRHCVCVDSD